MGSGLSVTQLTTVGGVQMLLQRHDKPDVRMTLPFVTWQVSAATRQTVLDAVNAVPSTQAARRVHTAVALTMISPEFIVQK